jgi:glycoside/pentoside/hexuronide:cation symporter, GPH family
VGKKLSYATGFIVMALSLLVLFFFGHILGMTFTLIMMFFIGAGMGFTYAMPYSIVSDAIEYDYLCTGERREGAFLGVWTWGLKIGQALAILAMGIVLDVMGYVANLMPQAPSALLGIRLFLGPISAAVFIIAAIVLSRYPITEQKYNEICVQIADMEVKKGITSRK